MSSDDESVGRPSIEAQSEIALRFVSNAPAGEVDAVLEDVRALVDAEALESGKVAKALEQHHTRVYSLAEIPGEERKIVLCPQTKQGLQYVSSHTKKAYAVDMERLSAQGEGEEAAERFPADKEEFRAALVESMSGYMDKYYKTKGDGRTGLEVLPCDDGYTIIISSHNRNDSSCWSGRWQGVWTVRVADGAGKVTGTINVETHYYEDGNMQMDITKECNGEFRYEDAGSFAKGVRRVIDTADDDLPRSLREWSDRVGGEALKRIRRHLPVSGVKMDWNVEKMRLQRGLAGQ
jgi:capping protein alpha